MLIITGKFCLLFTFCGENRKGVNSKVTHNLALFRIKARFGFIFVYIEKNFYGVRIFNSLYYQTCTLPSHLLAP